MHEVEKAQVGMLGRGVYDTKRVVYHNVLGAEVLDLLDNSLSMLVQAAAAPDLEMAYATVAERKELQQLQAIEWQKVAGCSAYLRVAMRHEGNCAKLADKANHYGCVPRMEAGGGIDPYMEERWRKVQKDAGYSVGPTSGGNPGRGGGGGQARGGKRSGGKRPAAAASATSSSAATSAAPTRPGPFRGRGGRGGGGGGGTKCYRCEKPGHNAKDCRVRL